MLVADLFPPSFTKYSNTARPLSVPHMSVQGNDTKVRCNVSVMGANTFSDIFNVTILFPV